MKNFISIYNNASSLSLKGKTLQEQYDMLGMLNEGRLSSREIVEKLKKCIRQYLTPVDKNIYICRYDLKKLQDAFWYSMELNGMREYKKFYAAICELLGLMGGDMKMYEPLTSVDKWHEAIKYLKCYQELQDVHSDDALSIGNEQQQSIVLAVKRLEKKGVRFRINNDNELEFCNANIILREIENLMESIGGVRFVNTCLSQITFDAAKGRLMFPKQGNKVDYRVVEPEIPWGYLFNLAFRKTNCKGSDSGLKKHLSSLIQNATDICLVLYPVHNFNGWLDVFEDNPKVALRKWIVFETLMDVPQTSQNFCYEMMDFLIDALMANGMDFNHPYQLVDIQALMHELSGCIKDKEFVRVKISELRSFRSNEIKETLLRDITNTLVNPNYENPLEIEKVNFMDKPVIGLPNGDLLLYPSSIGSMGWYESMMSGLREQYKDIDNFVGLKLEDFVKQKLVSKDILFKCGTYCVDKIDGECDVVVETGKEVLLMELKKKNLTRKARSGYLYQIILDFAASIVYSQEQAHRTEALVMRKGLITLTNAGTEYVLENKNRVFEKITVTLNEYGPLHERMIQQQILKMFYRYTFHVDEDEIRAFEKDEDCTKRVIKGYKTLCVKQGELCKYIEELAQYNPPRKYQPFFDSWFFSIEQLCYLIGLSSGCDDFVEKLSCLKYVSLFTKDFWTEVDFKLNMHTPDKK